MSDTLRKNSIGVVHVVCFVIATAAPLAVLVGVAPAAIAFGNGVGVPGSFIATGALYILFSVGYAAMSRYVRSAGAFYAFISRGLGGICGVGGAFLALVAYAGVQIAVFTLIGLFVGVTISQYAAVQIPWWVLSLAAVGAVQALSRRTVAFSGRVLGVLLALEILIVVVLDAVVTARGAGAHNLSFAAFHPGVVLASGFGASLAFVVPSFLGFEASTIFAEEARDPARTIPRATYIAVTFIAVLYAFSAWAVIQSYDPAIVVDAARRNPANFYFDVSTRYLGRAATNAMTLLLWTSLFAAALSLQNTVARYLFALGRDGLLWSGLAATHPRYQSPHVAGVAQTVIAAATIGLCAGLQVDPYATLFSWATALAALCILVVQALAGLAIAAFFRASPHGASLWTRLIAPLASSIGLVGCAWAIVINLPTITGSTSSLVWSLPLLVAGIFGMGMVRAAMVKRRDPARYLTLGQTGVPT